MNDHERGFTLFLAGPSQRRVLTLLELGPGDGTTSARCSITASSSIHAIASG